VLDSTAEKRDRVDRRIWSDRQSARRHAQPPDAGARVTEVAVVVRNIAKSLYALAASSAWQRKMTVTKGGVLHAGQTSCAIGSPCSRNSSAGAKRVQACQRWRSVGCPQKATCSVVRASSVGARSCEEAAHTGRLARWSTLNRQRPRVAPPPDRCLSSGQRRRFTLR